MSQPLIQCEPRGSLYFGRYQYVISMPVPVPWILRTLDDASIRRRMNSHKEYLLMQGAQSKWERTEEMLHYTITTAKDLRELSGDFTHRVWNSDHIHVYTNQQDHLDLLRTRHPDARVRQADVCRPGDVIMLKSQPRYPFRSYFRNRELDPQRKQTLWSWIQAQDPDLQPSPVTQRFFTDRGNPYWGYRNLNQCQDHFYVEHTSLDHVIMLSMIYPGLIRKTMHVQKQP